MELEDKISELKGVGEKTGALYHKLKIDTIENLLEHYPRGYLRYEEPVDIQDAQVGTRVAIRATVNSYVELKKMRTITVASFTARDFTGSVKMTWFNSPYIKKSFHIGQTYIFVGVLTVRNYQKVMEHPETYTESKYLEKRKELQPIYALTKGLTNARIQKDVKAVYPTIAKLEEYLPLDVAEQFGLMGYGDAIRQIHFPLDLGELEQARHRLIFDEFFLFLVAMRRVMKHREVTENSFDLQQDTIGADIVGNLPYSLTGAQEKALSDIKADLTAPSVMNRLIQGDVGSGKTIVALLSLVFVCENGYQGALMAPTEVLARQHYEKFDEMLAPYGIRVGLLVGSLSAAEKRSIRKQIQEGDLDLVIGTHALIQDKVEFRSLALVVTDEQHRFGVRQRELLSEKGSEPHILVMSATPIPRTLGIILYGDLDITVMNELPKNRLPIKNVVIEAEKRPTAYHFLEKELQAGHQAYVVCPKVADSEGMAAENVIGYAEQLKQEFPPYVQVAYLHGKMSPKEKTEIMEAFYNREIHVLVSTTVIEVGIDNPNATVMMIENAERFGLAQLHQLRGRVGRGKAQSYCIFVNTSDKEEAKERLDVLYNSNDGFHIANEDLRLRGPGDFFGVRQSGEMWFVLADIYEDAPILKQAHKAIEYLEQQHYDFTDIRHNKLQEKVDMALNL